MRKNILITGASGLLAKQLHIQLEEEYNIRFLTRKVENDNEFLWNIEDNYVDPDALKDVHHIIHLAGCSIADKRWTKERQQLIYSSRIDSAKLILNELIKQQLTIDSFISASAIGYYGSVKTSEILNEESPNGEDFLSDVCYKWEDAAQSFKVNNVANRVSVLRLGIILSSKGGALKKMLGPVKWGIGAAIGSGTQIMPWIHIQDLTGMFKHLIEQPEINGTFNAVSPANSTNSEVTQGIAKILGKKLILPNIPAFIMKLLLGEMAVILLKGNRVSSIKIVKSGFKFKYPNLESALKNLIMRNVTSDD